MNVHVMRDNFYTKRLVAFLDANFPREDHCFIILSNRPKLGSLDAVDGSRMLVMDLWQVFRRLKHLNSGALRKMIGGSDAVYFHLMGTWSVYILLRYCGKKQKTIWLPWGRDIYEHIGTELLDDDTEIMLDKSERRQRFLFDIKKKLYIEYFRKKAIARLDYIAVDFKSEYDLIKRHYDTRAEYRRFHYPNPVDFQALDDLMDSGAEEKQKLAEEIIRDYPELAALDKFPKLVQVGNSGFPTNNHIDVLKMLSGIGASDFGVVCPLGYGRPEYAASVIKAGMELLGDRFIPLTRFVKPDAYFQVLRRVDTAVMNHNRQQGKGNIIPLVYLGKKVYLKENVKTFQEFRSIGISIESTDGLLAGDMEGLLLPYDNAIKETNRKIIMDRYSSGSDAALMTELFYGNTRKISVK